MKRKLIAIFTTFLTFSSVAVASSKDTSPSQNSVIRLGLYTGFGDLRGDLASSSNVPVTPTISLVGSDRSSEHASRPLAGLIIGFEKELGDGFFAGGEFDLGFNFFCVEDDFVNQAAANSFVQKIRYQGYLVSSLVFGYQINETWDARIKLGISLHNIAVEALNVTDNRSRSTRVFNVGFVPAIEFNYHIDHSKAVFLALSYDIQKDVETNILDVVNGGNATTNNTFDLSVGHFYAKLGFLFKF